MDFLLNRLTAVGSTDSLLEESPGVEIEHGSLHDNADSHEEQMTADAVIAGSDASPESDTAVDSGLESSAAGTAGARMQQADDPTNISSTHLSERLSSSGSSQECLTSVAPSSYPVLYHTPGLASCSVASIARGNVVSATENPTPVSGAVSSQCRPGNVAAPRGNSGGSTESDCPSDQYAVKHDDDRLMSTVESLIRENNTNNAMVDAEETLDPAAEKVYEKGGPRKGRKEEENGAAKSQEPNSSTPPSTEKRARSLSMIKTVASIEIPGTVPVAAKAPSPAVKKANKDKKIRFDDENLEKIIDDKDDRVQVVSSAADFLEKRSREQTGRDIDGSCTHALKKGLRGAPEVESFDVACVPQNGGTISDGVLKELNKTQRRGASVIGLSAIQEEGLTAESEEEERQDDDTREHTVKNSGANARAPAPNAASSEADQGSAERQKLIESAEDLVRLNLDLISKFSKLRTSSAASSSGGSTMTGLTGLHAENCGDSVAENSSASSSSEMENYSASSGSSWKTNETRSSAPFPERFRGEQGEQAELADRVVEAGNAISPAVCAPPKWDVTKDQDSVQERKVKVANDLNEKLEAARKRREQIKAEKNRQEMAKADLASKLRGTLPEKYTQSPFLALNPNYAYLGNHSRDVTPVQSPAKSHGASVLASPGIAAKKDILHTTAPIGTKDSPEKLKVASTSINFRSNREKTDPVPISVLSQVSSGMKGARSPGRPMPMISPSGVPMLSKTLTPSAVLSKTLTPSAPPLSPSKTSTGATPRKLHTNRWLQLSAGQSTRAASGVHNEQRETHAGDTSGTVNLRFPREDGCGINGVNELLAQDQLLSATTQEADALNGISRY